MRLDKPESPELPHESEADNFLHVHSLRDRAWLQIATSYFSARVLVLVSFF